MIPPLTTTEGRKALFEAITAQAKGDLKPGDPELSFLALCLTRRVSSWSQLLQDLYVVWKLKGKPRGYFVDIGAWDGLSINNTGLLEDSFGWTGVLVEPNPDNHAAIAVHRRAPVDRRAVSDVTGQRVDFKVCASNPERSGIGVDLPGETITVETVSLLDLLRHHKAPKVIDYLSLDTEGNEPEILEAFDFSYRFRVITVEHNFDETRRRRIHERLTRLGYRREFEKFSRFDDWYFDPKLAPS